MSTTMESDLLRLVATVHEAAMEPSQWPRFLANYASTLNAEVAFLQQHCLSQSRSTIFATFGMTGQFSDSYNQHYSRLNVWRDHARSLYVSGRVFVDQEVYPRQLLKRTEFFNDHLLPNHATQCLTAVVRGGTDEPIALTVLRDESRPTWDRQNSQTASTLLPHIIRAYQTYERLQSLEARETALSAVSFGVLLLGSKAQVVFANAAAETILRRNDGLAFTHGVLTADDTTANGELLRLIEHAASPGESLDCPHCVVVPRRSMLRPYQVTAAPCRGTIKSLSVAPQTIAIVFLVDPEQVPTLPVEALRRLYGLTASEAKLAIELGAGRTVAAAADHLVITYETARTHLRRIFSKTQTSRQSELVSLLLRFSMQAPKRGLE
jgi:DNA-binding CsgD family transcriptional regulator